MYNHPVKIALILMLSTSLIAYEETFYNNTDTHIAIAVQFGDDPQAPLFKRLIKQNGTTSFVAGEKDIPDIMWSLCLKNVYYVQNPTHEQIKHYFAQAPWRKAHVTWSEVPLASVPKPRKPFRSKKQNTEEWHIVRKKKPVPVESKSLCKDRHFEITQDQDGVVVITGSLVE